MKREQGNYAIASSVWWSLTTTNKSIWHYCWWKTFKISLFWPDTDTKSRKPLVERFVKDPLLPSDPYVNQHTVPVRPSTHLGTLVFNCNSPQLGEQCRTTSICKTMQKSNVNTNWLFWHVSQYGVQHLWSSYWLVTFSIGVCMRTCNAKKHIHFVEIYTTLLHNI